MRRSNSGDWYARYTYTVINTLIALQDVVADEDAFKKTQDFERIKQEKIRKEQEHVNRTREQNARRKMDKVESREWDSGKPSGDWKQTKRQPQDEMGTSTAPLESPRRGRGSASGRGRGRGRRTNNAEKTEEATLAVPENHADA